MRRRLTLALAHLGVSALVITTFVLWVIFVWYPSPLAQLQGVTAILLVLVFVDVCLGPLLTFVIASPHKARRELIRDIAIIGLCRSVRWATVPTRPLWPAQRLLSSMQIDLTSLQRRNSFGRKDESRRIDNSLLLQYLGRFGRTQYLPSPSQSATKILFGAVDGGPDLKRTCRQSLSCVARRNGAACTFAASAQ